MTRSVVDAKTIKSIGSSGQISLGKEFAGLQVLVETPAKGVWIILTATIIPDHEAWLHEDKTKSSLKKSIEWASKHSAMASDPDVLPLTRNRGLKLKVRAA
jgi:hypothetical protein